MNRRVSTLAVLAVTAAGLVTGAGVANAFTPVADDAGREWRQLYETTGISWTDAASVCPRDGQTPCSGSVGGRDLSGWVWAKDRQVVELMGGYAPQILTAEPPSVSGEEYFGPAANFLADMRWTFYVSGYGFYSESTRGWTATRDADGQGVEANAGWGWYPYTGGFDATTGAPPPEASPYRGLWLWRPAPCRDTTPTIVGTARTDVIEGTAGDDVIVGLGGNDTVNGNGGNDIICGAKGADVIDGGEGNDLLDGDAGHDTVRGAAGADTINGGLSNDSLFGGAGSDFLDGGPNNDSIRGNSGQDTCASGEILMSSCEVL